MSYISKDFENYTNEGIRTICKDYDIEERKELRNKKALMIEKIVEYLNKNNITFKDKSIYQRKKYPKNKSDTSSIKLSKRSIRNSKKLNNDIITDDESILLSDSEDKNKNNNDKLNNNIINDDESIILSDNEYEEENNEKELNKNENESKNKYKLIEYCEENVKILSENKINIIYHISDIHIKPYKNISDFYHFDDVFEKLTNIINKDEREKLLVITGDIFDNKEKLTQSSLRKFQEYLEKINCEKIIITGNHDKNLNHIDSHDTLISVVSGYKDIHYLQYTGVYRYGEIDFYVNSLLDEKIIRIEEKTNKYNIALYHGMVRPTTKEYLDNFKGLKRLDNFDKNEKIQNITNFGYYDYALLGDVHKQQYLDTAKTAWYASSLLQKDFGETLDLHGYMLLDLENSKWSFNNIKSNYGYVNIILENDTYKLENDLKEHICKNMNVKFKININVKDKDKLIKKVKEELNINIINQKEKIMPNNENIIEENIIQELGNQYILNEEEEFEKYILENKEKLQLLLKDKIDNNMIKEVVKIHKENLKNFDDNGKGNNFKLDFIEFKNIMKYGTGDKNRINFKDGVYIVQGQNAIGKSSLIKIIQFALFGIKSDITTIYKIINKNKRLNINDNYIHIGFTINNDKYIVERNKITISEEKKKKAKYGDVKLIKNGNLIVKDKTNLDKEIENIISNNENFKNLSLLNDKEKINFINTTDKERLKKFEELLGLNKYIEFENNIKKKLTDIRKNYSYLKGQLEENKKNIKEIDKSIIKSIEDKLKDLYVNYNSISLNNTKNKEQLDINNDKIKELNKKIIPLENIEKVNIEDKVNIENYLINLNEELKILNDEIVLLKNIEKVKENKLIKDKLTMEEYIKIYKILEENIKKINITDISKIVNHNNKYKNIENYNIEDLLKNYKENISKINNLNKEKHEYEIIIKQYKNKENIVSEEIYNKYKLKLNEINKIYNEEILENINKKGNNKILDIEDIKLVNIELVYNKLLKYEEELKELNEERNKLGKKQDEIKNNNIFNDKDYNKAKKYNKNIEKILGKEHKKNSKYMKNLNIDIDDEINEVKLYDEFNKLDKECIEIETILKNFKDIKKIKCTITNDNELENIKYKLNIIKNEINEINKNNLVHLLNNNYDKEEIKKILELKNIEIKYLKENIDYIYHYLNNDKIINNDKDKLEKELNKLNDEIKNYENNKKYIEKIKYKNDLENKEKEKKEIKYKIEKYENEFIYIEKELENYKLNKEIKDKNNKIIIIENKKTELIKNINEIEEIMCNINYWYNKMNTDIASYEYYIEYMNKKKELDNLISKIKNLENINIDILENIEKIYNNYLILKDEIDLYNKNEIYKNKIKELKEKEKEYKNKINEREILDKKKENIGKYELYINNKEINIKYENEIEILNNKIKDIKNNINLENEKNIQSEIKLQEKELMLLKEKIEENENNIKDFNIKTKKYEEITNILNIHELYRILVNGSEYPSLLLELYIKNIEKEINKNIKYFMNDKIIFKKENNNLLLYKENIDNGEINLTESSGYEQLIICSIIKLILKNNNIYSNSDIMMIDEVMDDINELNYDKIELLVKILLKSYNKIIIITHNNEIKDVLEDIEVLKHNIKIDVKNDRSYIK